MGYPKFSLINPSYFLEKTTQVKASLFKPTPNFKQEETNSTILSNFNIFENNLPHYYRE